MPDQDGVESIWTIAEQLAGAAHEADAAVVIARAAAALIGADTVHGWMFDRRRGFRLGAAYPDASETGAPPADELSHVVAFGVVTVGPGQRPYRSRMFVPLFAGARPMGALELRERRRAAGPFTEQDAGALADLVRAADASLAAVKLRAARERDHLAAVARLTRLYDIARSLFGALDFDALVRAIAARAEAALDVQAAHFWLPDEEGARLTLVAAVSPAGDEILGWELPVGEGLAGQVAASREEAVVDDPATAPDFAKRRDVAAGVEAGWFVARPVVAEDGALLGVVEVVGRPDQPPLDAGELTLLREIAHVAAMALMNVRRLDAERRLSDLSALLETVEELSQHLDVQKVAFALVHKTAAVLAYRRAAVGLLRGQRLDVAAVSGQTFVDTTQPDIRALTDLMDWAAGLDEGLYVVEQPDGEIDTSRPETREKFKAYFAGTGSRSFLAIPLKDDEGRIGVFTLEAAEAYAFSERDMELAGLVAAQATVALRNAGLYAQLPMPRVFRPFTRKGARFRDLPRRGKLIRIAAAVAALVVLFVIPAPLRVSGEARVLPQRRWPVTAQVEGRVAQILVREGDRVVSGQVIALLDDSDARAGFLGAQANAEQVERQMNSLRAAGLIAEANTAAADLAGRQADVTLWTTRLGAIRVRAPVDGVIATPRVEEQVGARLARGDLFCELVEPGAVQLEIAVPEADVSLVAPGASVKVKLNAFPTASWRGTVQRVGVVAAEEGGERVFLVRAALEGNAAALRPGLTGRAKINTGPASVARILLRRPARWLWSVLWRWLP